MIFVAVLLLSVSITGKAEMNYIEVKNPVYPIANDPDIVRHDGTYYYCYAAYGSKVCKVNSIAEIDTTAAKDVWIPSKDTALLQDVWAPELHYIDGNWYIYFAASVKTPEDRRMYVLRGTTQDPTDPFVLAGQISDSSDRWAIDGTVFDYKGHRYFVWSGWRGFTDIKQDLYIAEMDSPTTLKGERVQIATPKLSWETIGKPIEEGPAVLVDEEHDAVSIVFSASGSWTDQYSLGELTLTGDDPLDPGAWTKREKPVLRQREGAYGPGHCCFVDVDDGSTWMVYHCNKLSGTGWGGRSMWIQPVYWKDGKLRIGELPVSPAVLRVPVSSDS